MRLWSDARSIWCEVSDSGQGIDNADQVGLAQRPFDEVTGRGIWMVRLLADQVFIQTGQQGTTITIAMALTG